ncbi:MAG TPA: DAK2 domain-containing protein [Acidimicrobiia bacterium]|nr:DAK2 domain-containing protein [Acidimicrobiia bacterium]
MPALSQLRASDLRRVVLRFRDALRLHQQELNRLNVYPVPDGDTGTNMALTLESVSHELDTAETMDEVCRAISHGSLMGARGNSGVILSQILRGLADEFRGRDEHGAPELASALQRASDAAYEAVMRPVEGTILTVVRETAAAAVAAAEHGLAAMIDAASAAADASVARTPELLPVLREAGVVDAGGKGFTLLLAAFAEVVTGRPIPEPDEVMTPAIIEAHLRGDDVADLRYEVMYLLEADDHTIPAFRDTWASIGDSIVVVGGDGLWNCHVHTNDIGAAVEAGIDAGRPRNVRVTDLFDQVHELHPHAPGGEHDWVSAAASTPAEIRASAEPVATAVVAVAVGDGVRRMFASLGVHAVIAGGQSMNPSTAQILEAVEGCSSQHVIVLPNNKNIVPVARQVDALSTRDVEVVPTTSVVEGLSALVAYDPNAPLATNLEGMLAAVQRVRTGEVTRAVRDSSAECGPIREGDWIALDGSGIWASVSSPVDAARALLDRLVDDDTEIVTVLVGADAPAGETARLRELVELAYPHVEVEFHEGGQPLYPYLLGVE